MDFPTLCYVWERGQVGVTEESINKNKTQFINSTISETVFVCEPFLRGTKEPGDLYQHFHIQKVKGLVCLWASLHHKREKGGKHCSHEIFIWSQPPGPPSPQKWEIVISQTNELRHMHCHLLCWKYKSLTKNFCLTQKSFVCACCPLHIECCRWWL